jgi:hypothetical protein
VVSNTRQILPESDLLRDPSAPYGRYSVQKSHL